jgi:hypothetical protein
MNSDLDPHEPDAWIDLHAEGLTQDHVGRRITVLTTDGVVGVLHSWRPMHLRTRHGLAGIAHIVNATGDHPVALRTRTLVRIHLETA